MKHYLVKFKPLGPYFFGNDKIFSFNAKKENGRYFISGENMPSQSTILGAIRYMLLPVKKSDWNYNAEDIIKNNEAVGEFGFEPERNNAFGKIKKISPVFITGDEGAVVRTPFDHIVTNSEYTPFSQYEEYTLPGEVKKLYAKEYNAKEGIACSYMQLKDGAIIETDKIFASDIRVGINRSKDKDGFFKKEYKILLGNYSFAVYLDLDDSITPENNVVQLGQGKSTFAVTFTEEENNLAGQTGKHLHDDVVYCMSDTFVCSSVYNQSAFSVTGLKTYRHFLRKNNTVKKGDKLYNIIEAGSIFIPYNPNEFISEIENNPVYNAGYNNLVYKKREKK